jgi:hypothetical protein|tara:strand:+ start:184 stop:348 length:165 start_codon:yes stop_codon:yes gene_type:complete
MNIKKKKKKDYWITNDYEHEEMTVDDSILDVDTDKYLDSYSDEQIVSEYVKKGN